MDLQENKYLKLSIEDKILLWEYYKKRGMIFPGEDYIHYTNEELLLKLKELEYNNLSILGC